MNVTLTGQRYLTLANIDDAMILISPMSKYFAAKVRQPDETTIDILLLRTVMLLRLAPYIYADRIAEVKAENSGKPFTVKKRSTSDSINMSNEFIGYTERLIKAHTDRVQP